MGFDELVRNLIEKWGNEIYKMHRLGHFDQDVASHVNAREYFSTDSPPLPLCSGRHIKAVLDIIGAERLPEVEAEYREYQRFHEKKMAPLRERAERLRAETARVNILEKRVKKELAAAARDLEKRRALNRPMVLPFDDRYYNVWFEYYPGPDPRIDFAEAVVADL